MFGLREWLNNKMGGMKIFEIETLYVRKDGSTATGFFGRFAHFIFGKIEITPTVFQRHHCNTYVGSSEIQGRFSSCVFVVQCEVNWVGNLPDVGRLEVYIFGGQPCALRQFQLLTHSFPFKSGEQVVDESDTRSNPQWSPIAPMVEFLIGCLTLGFGMYPDSH